MTNGVLTAYTKPAFTLAFLLTLTNYLIFWCPHAESNHDLMITNQLHDLHATGAQRVSLVRIIADLDACWIILSFSVRHEQLFFASQSTVRMP